MLTATHIKKVARLLEQTGEPRAGFLHDESSKLNGEEDPIATKISRATGTRPNRGKTKGPFHFRSVQDKKTGEIVLIQG